MSGKIIDVSDNLNYGNGRGLYPSMQVYNNELYCAWTEGVSDSNDQIKIKKYNGINWTEVPSNLNYIGNRATNPNICVYNGELYCVWVEGGNYKQQIKMKKYNGSIWSEVSSNLNYDGNTPALNPTMEVYKDELYCAWHERNISIKKYNGNTWINISSNLNYKNNSVGNTSLRVYKDKLYCVWSESNGSSYQIKVKKYDGSTWTNVTDNLNYNGNEHALCPIMQVYKDELYCAWHEIRGSNNQIKIKKYNGVNWDEVSDNINYNENVNATLPKLQVYKDELYCIWREDNGYNELIKINRYNGDRWINISDNLNYDKNKNGSYPIMQVYNNELYCTWCEYNENNIYQIKVKKHNSLMQKFLIKQNDSYISIKAEFYKNGQYQALTLEGDTVPNDNDFINKGFDDLDDLCKEVSVENNIITVKSNASDYEDGKLFSFDIDSELKNINNIE